MPPPGFIHGPGKGGSVPNRGRRQYAERSFGHRARITLADTSSPTASVSHGRNNRKRPGDGVVDDSDSKKRCKVTVATPSPSPLASNRHGFTGPPRGTPYIDLTGDDPQASSSGSSNRRVKGTFLDNPTGEPRRAPRYGDPFVPSTPTPGTKKKVVIDLTSDDSDDDLTKPAETPLRKTPQSEATKNQFGLATPKTPAASGRQRPVSKSEQSRPAISAPKTGAALLTPGLDRRRPTSGPASQSHQLTNGSPGAYKGRKAPFKSAPAQGNTEVVLANKTKLVVREREFDQDQLRRGSDPVPQVVVRDRDRGTRKLDDEIKNADSDRAVDGRDGGGANRIQSHAEPDGTGGLSKTKRFRTRQILLRPVAVGASQLQEPSGSTVTGQAQDQSQLVGGGRSEEGDEGAGRGSTILRLGNDHKQDPKDKQPPSTPRRNEKKTLIVTLKGLTPHKLRRIAQRPIQRPDIPMGTCFLVLMPPEIQDNIFRYLLLAEDPIQVLHRWSKLYQRQRSGLHTAILSTCKVMFRNASAFLYGQNVFRYLVRDRPQPGAVLSFKQDIFVETYMPLFRKLELKIERSRTERAYCNSLASAISLLNHHGADLYTLTMDVSPTVEGDTLSTVGYFYRNGEIIQALKALKTCFITVRVLKPETGDEPPRSLRRVLDMRTERGMFERPRPPPDLQLDDLCEMITLAYQKPSEVVGQGLFEEFEVVQRQNERRARSSRIAYPLFHDDEDEDDDDESSDDDDEDDSDFEG